ncbi:MAG TPA: 3-alpha domain-containing protein [Dongiaceae bacterium]
MLYHDKPTIAALQQMADLEVPAQSRRKIARRRLETTLVEDWSKRVLMPAAELSVDS